jgi:hypothetical protein
MDTVQVTSSNIESIGYDPQAKRLEVVFLPKGTRYHYHDVEQEDWRAFIGAESAGKHFAQVFKAKYTHCPGCEAEQA